MPPAPQESQAGAAPRLLRTGGRRSIAVVLAAAMLHRPGSGSGAAAAARGQGQGAGEAAGTEEAAGGPGAASRDGGQSAILPSLPQSRTHATSRRFAPRHRWTHPGYRRPMWQSGPQILPSQTFTRESHTHVTGVWLFGGERSGAAACGACGPQGARVTGRPGRLTTAMSHRGGPGHSNVTVRWLRAARRRRGARRW
jgi:hypothetical protein